MLKISVFILLSLLFLSCQQADQNTPCPTCTSIALHVAFVDSLTSETIIPQMVKFIKNRTDTFTAVDTSANHPLIDIIQKNYYLSNGTGQYTILVQDSTYGNFTIDSLYVLQNQEYRNCGILPMTLHLKIGVSETVMPKSDSVADFIILEKFAQGSCE